MSVSILDFSPRLQRFFVLCYSFTNRAIGGVAVGGMSLALKKQEVHLIVHVTLVSIGYIQLMSQGLLAMNPGSGWEEAFPYRKKCRIHWRLQALGTVLAFTGTTYAIFALKRNDYPFSLHGLMGFITMFFTVVTVIMGCIVNNACISRSKCIKICHSIIGCTTMTFAFVTYIIGMQKFIDPSRSNKLVYFYIVLAILSIIGVLTTPLTRVVRKLLR